MRYAILLVGSLFVALVARAQVPEPGLFTADGQPASWEQLLQAAGAVEVVFLGEQHDDTVAHQRQLRVLEALQERHGHQRPLVLSLEMFERDVQLVLDEYRLGLISEAQFLEAARPWSNYARDYRPLVEFARAHGWTILAANAPRRYVNRVSRLGRAALEKLLPEARAYLPPLPYPEPSELYRRRFLKLMRQDGHRPMHVDPERLLAAQALWDATMAYTLAEHLMRQPEALIVHVTGAFHVEGRMGTPEMLRYYRPGTRMLVVVFRPTADPSQFEPGRHMGLGDFIWLTPASPP
ncbi:MAG: ChaN family lipoprotein [Rhodothermus sp.]|nr:ChaN family lipoprotein [Rhodothermus sp.]